MPSRRPIHYCNNLLSDILNYMEYPRTVSFEDADLRELLKEKNDLILEGREVSVEIEQLEVEMKAADEAITAIEKAVDAKDLNEEADVLTKDMNVVFEKMQDVKKRLGERLKAAVAPEAIAVYENAKNKKEELENKRNKIGLKVQQFNDKIIPITRDLMKPYLNDEFEDYDTVRIEDGKIVGTIFSHMESFKEAFAKRKTTT